jgi:hypothetical protein
LLKYIAKASTAITPLIDDGSGLLHIAVFKRIFRAINSISNRIRVAVKIIVTVTSVVRVRGRALEQR